MKGPIHLLLGFLLLAAGDHARAALLEIDSHPAGLDAWADGRYLGRTPLTAVLREGETNLRLSEPSDSVYSAPVVDTVLSLADAETLRVFFPVGPLVSIHSRPFGLSVLRDGRRVGSTPFAVRLAPSPRARWELETPGGLVAIPSESLRVRGSWSWMGEGRTGQPSDRLNQTRWHRLGRTLMPAVALAMAAGGLIVEDAADRSYRRYLRTADPDQIRSRYDQTRRRDRWAAAFWIAAEVSVTSAVIAWIVPEGNRDDGRGSDR